MKTVQICFRILPKYTFNFNLDISQDLAMASIQEQRKGSRVGSHIGDLKNAIVAQPKPKLFQPLKGFGNQDPDLLKNCIKDLEPLTDSKTIIIRKKIIPLDILTGWETENEYDICTKNGDVLYKVIEETDCCIRCEFGSLRPFNFYINTPDGRPVIQLTRSLSIASFLCSQFVQTLQVFCPPGRLIGTIYRNHTLLVPKFQVKNQFAETEFWIEGPLFTCNCCGDVDFEIFNADLTLIGKIGKRWSGILKEAFFRTEYFGIQFPLELDIFKKVMLLGVSFLIDHIYFDH